MTVVVADTSPLNYLILIEALDLLPRLYGRIVIPVEVLNELSEPAGRLEASRRGIPNTGTVGVLRAGSIARLVDLPSALARLVATNFRVSRQLLDGLIEEDAERRRERQV
jgi:predicted nucleic acid-binding protein